MAIAPGDYVLGKPERYPVVQVGYVQALRGDYAHVYFVLPDGHAEDYYLPLVTLQRIAWTPDSTDPVVMALLPDQAQVGDPDLTLRVLGTGFTAETVIVFGAYDEPTTLINENEVRTGVKPILFVVPDQVPVKVRHGAGGPESNALIFTFTGGRIPPAAEEAEAETPPPPPPQKEPPPKQEPPRSPKPGRPEEAPITKPAPAPAPAPAPGKESPKKKH